MDNLGDVMTKHRYGYGFLLAGLVVLIVLSKYQLQNQIIQDEIIRAIPPHQAYYHAPISINGNVEMDNFDNKTGAGTSESPYLISNLIITGGDVFDTVVLQNIDRYVIFFNCTIINSNHYGIKIVNCHRLWIENVTIFGCLIGGIRVESCTGNSLKISNNTIINNGNFGISIETNENIHLNLTHNQIFGHLTYGIYVSYSDSLYLLISHNNLSLSCQYGIYLHYSDSVLLQANSLRDSNYGVYISGSYSVNLTDNCFFNHTFGIYLSGSHYVKIDSNIIQNCTYGIYDYAYSYYVSILSNHLKYNVYAIYSYQVCYYPTIEFNEIKENKYGIYINEGQSGFLSGTIRNNILLLQISANFYPGPLSSTNNITHNNLNSPFITHEYIGTYAVESINNFIEWMMIDPDSYELTYDISLNGEIWKNLSNKECISGEPIHINIDGLKYGWYYFQFVGSDNWGGVTHDNVTVFVSNIFPTIQANYANNTRMEITQSPTQFQWNITDPSIQDGRLTIKLNNQIIPAYDNISWISPIAVEFEIDRSIETTYIFTFIVCDGLGVVIINHFRIYIQNSAPIISSPEDIIYDKDMTGNNIEWEITDPSVDGGTYTIWKNGTPLTSFLDMSWNESFLLQIDIDALEIGSHNFTLGVDDGYGKTDSDTVMVTVFNNIAPVIVAIETLTITENTRGNIINWTILDSEVFYPHYYIHRDEVMILSGIWISNQPIIVPIDGLSIATHNFTLIAIDGWGDSTQKTIMVIVRPNTAPTLSTLADITYTEGELDHVLLWHVEDIDVFYPYYQIYRNQLFIISGVWESNTTISLSVDGLTAGRYRIILTVYDGLGSQAEDKVIIHVLPKNPANLAAARWRTVGFVVLVVGGIGAVLFHLIQSRRRWDI